MSAGANTSIVMADTQDPTLQISSAGLPREMMSSLVCSHTLSIAKGYLRSW